ncbi:MAG: amino acid transporter [Gammaproteobacteria bacterium]|nr:amino acid transporter [Gammaproteobacteria bacterium]
MLILSFAKGMGLGASLIMAIGAQNAFVLGQAIRQNHALLIALVCAFLDMILIFSGVLGLGALIKHDPLFLQLATFGGVAFLLVYGLLALRRAFRPGHLTAKRSPRIDSAAVAVMTTLAISLLNPHVYLDTVILLGSIGGQLPGKQPLIFAAGASTASLLWFASLALAGRFMAPYLSEDKHWQRLDIVIGLTMWTIAASLLYGYINR